MRRIALRFPTLAVIFLLALSGAGGSAIAGLDDDGDRDDLRSLGTLSQSGAPAAESEEAAPAPKPAPKPAPAKPTPSPEPTPAPKPAPKPKPAAKKGRKR